MLVGITNVTNDYRDIDLNLKHGIRWRTKLLGISQTLEDSREFTKLSL